MSDTVAPGSPEILPTPLQGPFLVFRFRTGRSALGVDDLYDLPADHELARVQAALVALGSPPVRRVVSTANAKDLYYEEVALGLIYEDEAEAISPIPEGGAYASVTRYFYADFQGKLAVARRALTELAALSDEIDEVYAAAAVSNAATLVAFSNDPLANPPTSGDTNETWQQYQSAAPVGIDARYAWNTADGRDVGFCDLEVEWYSTHEDLVLPPLVYGVNAFEEFPTFGFDGRHGAAVLGVVLGLDNDKGGVGLAPAARTPIRVSRIFKNDDGTYTQWNIADAIIAAARDHLQAGDVLLIEQQLDRTALSTVTVPAPVEVDSHNLNAIRYAIAREITVIEAVGNGARSLDDTTVSSWGGRFVEGDPAWQDSGAILVSGSSPNLSDPDPANWHRRRSTCNFGARVDCFAWGEHVATCGVPTGGTSGLPSSEQYRLDFADSSAAAAIIAGAALLTQSAYKLAQNTTLSAGQLRELLRDPALGTDRSSLGIGVMPDLARVLPALGQTPDVYLRDNLADHGLIPSSGSLSQSPDIIAVRAPVADPQGTWGQGSPNQDRTDLGDSVLVGNNHHLYVRVRNRGGSATTATQATLYWAEPSTLLTPDQWNRIGATPPMGVPVGDVLTVSGELVWPTADQPGPGHYCYVAVLDDPRDPAPPIGGLGTDVPFDWEDFLTLVRTQNNIAWRNFNVVSGGSAKARGLVGPLRFLVAGAPDKARPFTVQLGADLPPGSQVWVHLPAALGSTGKKTCGEEGSWRALPPRRLAELGTWTLAASARHPVQILVRLPAWAEGHRPARLAARQLYRGQEVGRVSWQIGRSG